MTTNRPLSLFISSQKGELAEERLAVQSALSGWPIKCWLWENDAGARSEPTRNTYLTEVEACDVYIGLFWLGYGSYTREEFEHARQHHKPCLIYQKDVNIERRSQKLKAFLKYIQQVDSSDGLTVYHFKTLEQLTEQLKKDIMWLLTNKFRVNINPQSIDIKTQHSEKYFTTSTKISALAIKNTNLERTKSIKKTLLQYRAIMEITNFESIDMEHAELLEPSKIEMVLKTLQQIYVSLEQEQVISQSSTPFDDEILTAFTTMKMKAELDNDVVLDQVLPLLADDANQIQHQLNQNQLNTNMLGHSKPTEQLIESSSTTTNNLVEGINLAKNHVSNSRQDKSADLEVNNNTSLFFSPIDRDKPDKGFCNDDV